MGIVPEHKALVKPGQEFDRWTVIGRPFICKLHARRHAYVVVECRCGTIGVARQAHITSGASRSCGCLITDTHTKHGQANRGKITRLYSIWSNMLNRCKNPSFKDFHLYGGKGVRVCEEWMDYRNFHEWSMSNGYTEQLTIDRMRSSGDYEPMNCRWTTWSQQNRNRCVNRSFEAFGETKLEIEWSEDPRCVVSMVALRKRIRKGMQPETALTTPSRSSHGRNLKHENLHLGDDTGAVHGSQC